MRRGAATILRFASALACAAAIAIVLTGGFAVRPIALTLRDPIRPLLAAVARLAAAWAVAGEAFAGVARPYLGSRAAGGSDSSCYVLQAEAFARGRATLDNPVARVLRDVPNAVFAPIGFLPSPREYGTAVPICAPGLALVMAGASLVRPSAVLLVVPVCAALLVWLTFLYGRRLQSHLSVPVRPADARRSCRRGLGYRARFGPRWVNANSVPVSP